MSIPIVINNFNRLSTTRKLYEDLNRLGYHNIYILDNGSTYPKLLEWYHWENVQILSNGYNQGSLGIYNGGYLENFRQKGIDWVVYTDSDIELNPNTPPGFIEHMIDKSEKHGFTKCGTALQINDLPDNLSLTPIIKNWESKYWVKQVEKDIYEAELDTTFCCIRSNRSFDYKALRFAGNLTAKHIPWYTDFSNLTEEEQYYLNNVDVAYSGYKRYYELYLSNINV